MISVIRSIEETVDKSSFETINDTIEKVATLTKHIAQRPQYANNTSRCLRFTMYILVQSCRRMIPLQIVTGNDTAK